MVLLTSSIMLPRIPMRTLGIRSYVYKQYSSESGKKTFDDGKLPDDKIEAKNTVTDSSEKIQNILKGMVEDSAKRGTETFKSKFVIDNTGLKSRRLSQKPIAEKSDGDLVKAASAVAESLGNEGKVIENDLISKVLDIQNSVQVNWSELISGMNIDHTPGPVNDNLITSRAQEIKIAMSKGRDRSESRARLPTRIPPQRDSFQNMSRRPVAPIDLFGTESLGIFTERTNKTGTKLELWDYLKENELRIIVTHPPANYFQKMILWTNQGKLWKFPIDNEQDLNDETDVHFSEHIFLENLLEWCPRKGPIRHFMELVCVGLSKNPYMPIQEKRDHIAWFKEYFDSKKELLLQVGALPGKSSDKPKELSQ